MGRQLDPATATEKQLINKQIRLRAKERDNQRNKQTTYVYLIRTESGDLFPSAPFNSLRRLRFSVCRQIERLVCSQLISPQEAATQRSKATEFIDSVIERNKQIIRDKAAESHLAEMSPAQYDKHMYYMANRQVYAAKAHQQYLDNKAKRNSYAAKCRQKKREAAKLP